MLCDTQEIWLRFNQGSKDFMRIPRRFHFKWYGISEVITSLFRWVIIFVWSLELEWNLNENVWNLKIIFVILSEKTQKERRGLPLEQNMENRYRYIWLNKKLISRVFYGHYINSRKDLQEKENYQIIKIIIYKYIHKHKKRFTNFSLNCFIKGVN